MRLGRVAVTSSPNEWIWTHGSRYAAQCIRIQSYREDTATRLPLRENVAGDASKRSDHLSTSYPKPRCVFDDKNHTLSINRLPKLMRRQLTRTLISSASLSRWTEPFVPVWERAIGTAENYQKAKVQMKSSELLDTVSEDPALRTLHETTTVPNSGPRTQHLALLL